MPPRVTPLVDPAATPSGRRLAWLASEADGVPRGSAFLRLFTKEGQTHLAELDGAVHPAERRQGVGTALLDAAVGSARADGRRALIAQARQGSPGDAFLAARGFRRVLTLVYARLELAAIDPDHVTRILEQPCPGYHLTSWTGVVPEELARSYAASRRAMDDMPMGDTDYGTVVWDVERVVAAAEAIAKRGDSLYTVAAVHTSSGTVVGFSELVLPGEGEGEGQHYGTAVLPEHRGHALGLRMKARAVLHAHRLAPALALLTDTAEENAPMRRVNDVLGYRPTHTSIEYQLDL
ncbi:GNAT family N-acetyltransferase [Streptomyces stelliscabiei]|uniref:GNAT family N-acetyltransferase n=1 Tax=Streptomyces stelliscabiei TaxID=146820 RepID=UPI0029BF8073|nr:GNAT family N-acetyltransferase [Streptomyces stelliscabiei]MDX2550963.1 GNAT family N-acetyltransferase [Streptomyces stelliscabiei]MDX2614750.1 GNAT family N-acetyltransferase [Streptomyces stelliscabiei]MDX2635650.1 GNAT family N-acetyltransferase [Streptomyces stelliscabiei]MDX2667282.1 GNAT family N-acetyltransferase [Streptomyces stelliscabiei]MDX2714571.1 GNAT family N-acetyltransferase [Streptomyces stelliscabiei]